MIQVSELVYEPDPADNLTLDQLRQINESMGRCPLCLTGEMQGGPRGGDSANFRCLNCGEEFWISFFGAVAMVGSRIHRYEPGLYRGPLLSDIYRAFDSITE